jgi:hypothetical protein
MFDNGINEQRYSIASYNKHSSFSTNATERMSFVTVKGSENENIETISTDVDK